MSAARGLAGSAITALRSFGVLLAAIATVLLHPSLRAAEPAPAPPAAAPTSPPATPPVGQQRVPAGEDAAEEPVAEAPPAAQKGEEDRVVVDNNLSFPVDI